MVSRHRTSTHARDEELVQMLVRCLEACRASELHCTLALDVGRREDDAASPARALQRCASLCAVTASSIGALHEPDLDAVASELEACLLACRAAGSACMRDARDPSRAQCAHVCDECAALCEALLARTSLAIAS